MENKYINLNDIGKQYYQYKYNKIIQGLPKYSEMRETIDEEITDLEDLVEFLSDAHEEGDSIKFNKLLVNLLLNCFCIAYMNGLNLNSFIKIKPNI